jgi:hypothetical protein
MGTRPDVLGNAMGSTAMGIGASSAMGADPAAVTAWRSPSEGARRTRLPLPTP